MQIFQIEKKELNEFLARQKYAQFVQSWEWGELMASEGKKVFRYGFKSDDGIFFALSLYKTKLFLGKNYLYIPRFDLVKLSQEQREFVFLELSKIAKKEKAVFVRVEPLSDFKEAAKFFKIKKTIDLQPKRTQMLDLHLSEDDLLTAMHQKTRYNIRLAEKKGVTVRLYKNNSDDFEAFWKIMTETFKRDGFRLHPQSHYRKMLELSEESYEIGIKNALVVRLFLAEFQNKIIAASLVSFFGDLTTYIHGASSDEQRNLMAPYALQWEAIRMAKNHNYAFYDFYGIDEVKWSGVTRFKKGFGGFEVGFLGAFDLVADDYVYFLYRGLRTLKRLLLK